MVRERDTSMYADDDAFVRDSVDDEATSRGARKNRRVVAAVVVPKLSDGEKGDYAPLNTPSHNSDDGDDGDDREPSTPVRILAESHDRAERFYYVLHDDNVIRKYKSLDIKKAYGELVDEYETAKEDDTLPPFDWADPRILSKSRVTTMRLPKTAPAPAKSKDKARKSEQADGYTDDEEASEPSSEDNSGGSDYEADEPAPRRSTRVTNTFAPKSKQKAKKPAAPSPKTRTRTSGRERKTVEYGGMQEISDSDVEMVDDDDEAPPPAKEKKLPRPRKKVLSRPAYGNIRHTKELSDDEDDDRDRLHVHRTACEKCGEDAAHLQVLDHRRKKRRKKNKRKSASAHSSDEDEELTEGEADFESLGAWIRCLKCCVVSHWKCLAGPQREEILRAVKDKEPTADDDGKPLPKRKKLDVFETTEFVCAPCSKGGVCFACKGVAVEQFQYQVATTAPSGNTSAQPAGEDVVMKDDTAPASDAPKTDEAVDKPLLFRCITCKRAAHYEHLVVPDAADVQEVAAFYQDEQDWTCDDCVSFIHPVEAILAWRPYPADAVEPALAPDDVPNHKNMLPREYLVKWEGRSYKRAQWVPHMWLLATVPAKLKNFVARGTLVKLLAPTASAVPSKGSTPFLEDVSGRPSPAPSDDVGEREFGPPAASSDATDRIPPQWYTIERVLDIKLWCPPGCGQTQKKKTKRDSGRRIVDDEDDEMDDASSDLAADARLADALQSARVEGEEPDSKMTQTVAGWEKRHGRVLTEDDIGLVVWAYFKYTDLSYDQGTWDAPPETEDAGYGAFRSAFKRFLAARTVLVKEKGGVRKTGKFRPIEGQPNLCKDESLALRDFQIDGLNFLYYNWWKGQSSILADEMGLGKTVQMTTLLGLLVAKHDAFPLLVVVPNSTLSNWMREFDRWAPDVRVVPFYGESKSRDIIKQYELKHETVPKGYTSSKFHVLLSTYESFTNVKDGFAVFNAVKNWEAIVVDEGQRLKSDSSLLFRRLTQLNARHRILMTGTPLNNNIRELFNLMNFLDPEGWADLPALEEKYTDLTEELLAELHEKLKPYFLRRTKADVLTLPPKNELIVPVSMTPLQKTVYKSVIGKNADLLQALLHGKGSKTAKTKLNNILMHLRKCIQHPYLVDPELERRDLSKKDTHRNLVDASAKLQLLKTMLPQLKARGHRVLLFSQFRLALNVIEDFLVAEGHTFRRLDGETKQPDRQKYMDDFNADGSDVFIFILSTRAGGVGINLFTADTVIVFDPDYNPHQDLQAIARAHRFGQKKTVLVFKLMMKDSAEEKIMQAGKKKLALDHLIVQSMDDDNSAGDDVQTLLTFGAKALFEEESTSQTITYSASDVEQLILRTESAVDVEQEDAKKGGLSFEFAKIWLPEKGGVEELAEEADATTRDDHDFWAKTLAQATAEQEAAKERERQQMGRGARRRKEVNYAIDGSPEKAEKKSKGRKSIASDDDDHDVDFTMPDAGSSDDDSGSFYGELEDPMSLVLDGSTNPAALLPSSLAPAVDQPVAGPVATLADPSGASVVKKKVKKRKLADQENVAELDNICGLCHQRHAARDCYMVKNPQNLLEYRKILFDDQVDEPYETRAAAVRAIDLELNQLGFSDMLRRLPIMPPHPVPLPADHKAKKRKTDPGPKPHDNMVKPPVLSEAPLNSRVTTVPKPAASSMPSANPFTSAPAAPHPKKYVAETSFKAPPATSQSSSVAPPTLKAIPSKRVTPPDHHSHSGETPPLERAAKSVVQSGTEAPALGMRQTTLPFARKDSKGSTDQCPVCERHSHPLMYCPTVQEGADSMRAAIDRLTGKPGMDGIVSTLRQLWGEKYAVSSGGKSLKAKDASSFANTLASSATGYTATTSSTSTAAGPSENPALAFLRRKSNAKPRVVDTDIIEISD